MKQKELPRLEEYGKTKVLMVDGKPWFAFAGEVHNSSCSNLEYYKSHVLNGIEQLNLNTIILPAYWEQIESEEGKFDFKLFDEILEATSQKKLKVILLWFGLWKNGNSTYVPQWMKLNRDEYPFVRKADGSLIYCISPLCQKAIEKDALAFAELMKHLKQIDGDKQTVIMVQVENEVGTLETDRDYSAAANDAFGKEIPEDMAAITKLHGSWEQCFNEDAAEMFMCYHYAKSVNQIASRGKDHYELPMVVNAWLAGKDEKPGKYPSGGPVQSKISFWRKLAPTIDLCVPDIYLENFKEICDIYAEQGFLFIPEARQDVKHISNVIFAFANYPSGGFAPFGIEDFLQESGQSNMSVLLQALNISMDAFQPKGTATYLRKIYQDLASIEQLVFQKRSEGKVHAFIREADEEGNAVIIGGMMGQLKFLQGEGEPHSAGFIIEESDNEWLVYGIQFILMPKPLDEKLKYGVLSFEEGHYEGDCWIVERTLNGDEQYVVSEFSVPKFYRLKWHCF